MADDTGISDSELWSSPVHARAPPDSRPRTPKTPKTPSRNERPSEPIDHEAALRKELAGVRNINEAIEGVIATLERAGGNMDTVSRTVNNASVLLNSWTRILSQTEHNQRLILNPNWKGATEDLAEQEAESLQKQLAAQRRAAQEEQKREELRRRREEEEESRRLAAAGPTRGTRGTRGARGTRGTRVRGRARGTTGSTFGSSSIPDSSTSTAGGRGTSGIGRGFGTNRGRYRSARGT